MRLIILIDNITHSDLAAEWGLSIWIEYDEKKILLDTGAGALFAENAEKLGLSLEDVDFGVLSHAHYDHADGMDAFFEKNETAPFHLCHGALEDCYGKKDNGYEYIGIRQGLLTEFADRIRYTTGMTSPLPGVTLLPHLSPNAKEIAEKARQGNLYRKVKDHLVYDDFSHEQSLIFSTQKGLVIFNSCCHAGADRIICEVAEAFPGEPIFAIVGGFHLYETPEDEVAAFAKRLAETGVQKIVTGHCTGEPAFLILKEILGDKVQQMASGLVLYF